ncbi:[FeFe] hydrogenase H-cluster maturation GTPase HydF [Provencibacterium massiliense]|uniref:[FeFe] hydrogenase H-cluster maturation GTPase HydF n=1 Tax=Provencibacterium massiliense TaxID=1841868 RepID=UPI0009A64AA0|nr:[FeFe] hydrogenase H-cluster maturation GTPase HydF [Provencibacterium massiliense]RGB67573.1 [FeFe] hydrogenase H-cluster maturation GTPase HydF [Harryflintia acetispora]
MPVNELNQTPNASRLHIALFGRRNSGKSSLVNALCGQQVALVSGFAGTTTDPVYKPVELYPLGPCVLIDTAGFDDEGELGRLRVEKSRQVLERTDLALLVLTAGQQDLSQEEQWLELLRAHKKPVVVAVNKSDLSTEMPALIKGLPHALVSARTGEGVALLKEKLIEAAPKDCELPSITGHLVGEGDHVLLIAPQDIQAPKGRLILPQVQTIRDLLDLRACVSVATTDKLAQALSLYREPPALIITDSQAFGEVYPLCPKGTRLTSFSVLMARYKGDIEEYVRGAAALDTLCENDKVLILEACSHEPLDGDIGRVKIPAALRKRVGQGLSIEVRRGADIPQDLTPYALVVHCGGCMFNRAHVLSRIAKCKEQGVPITNYGILLAKLGGILDKVVY